MSEQFYDDEIAPTLMALSKKCEAKGVPFLALVEYQPGKFGCTEILPPVATIGMRMAVWAARANGSADSLIMAMQEHAREHGHNSACLHLLGVPAKPV